MKDVSRGGVLVFVLVLMTASMVVVSAWTHFATLGYRTTIDQKAEERAFQTAEAGVDFVVALLNSKSVTGFALSGATIAQPVDEGIFDLQISGGGLGVSVVSTGWFGNQCQRVSGGASGYFGVLGGPRFYADSIRHVEIPKEEWLEGTTCPERPAPAYDVVEPTFADMFGGDCETLNVHDPTTGGGGAGDGWLMLYENGSGFNVGLVECEDGGAGLLCSDGSDTGVMYEALADYGSDDYTVSITQVDGSMSAALAARIQDNGDSYTVEWDRDGGTLYRNGSPVDSFNENVSDGSDVSLRVEGDVVQVLVNGVVFSYYTDPNPLQGGGVGMGLGNVINGTCTQDGLYDDFDVIEI